MNIAIDWQPWLLVLGRLHPMVLHFPIALVAVLAIVELGGVIVRRQLPRGSLLVLLWLNAIFAGVTAASGLQLAQEGGYEQETLTLHQTLGVAAAGACVLLALLASVFRARAVYRWTLFLALLLVLPAGHLGASLTHGDDFLTGPLQNAIDGTPPKERTPRPGPTVGGTPATPEAGAGGTAAAASTQSAPPATDGKVSYLRDIAPLMERYCNSCHGPKKHKADLRFDSPDAIRRGSENGSVLEPGRPADSYMVTRMHLPLADDDHMPPDGKPQPTPAEVALIERWIAEGGVFDGEPPPSVVAPEPDEPGKATPAPQDPPPPGGTPPAPGKGSGGQQARGDVPPAVAPDAAAVAALHTALVDAAPVAAGSPLLRIGFAAIAPQVDDAAFQRLVGPVAGHVAELSLARTRVTDAAMPLVGTMTPLRRLDLRGTAVTAAGLVHLAGLPELRELVLAQTPLLDPVVATIASLPALERVYLWGAGLGAEPLAQLRARPGLLVDAGDAAPEAPLEVEPEVVLGKPKPAAAEAPPPAAEPAKAQPPAPINDRCPVSQQPVDPAFTLEHEGRVVGFCCGNCPKRFRADPAAFPVQPRQ